MGVIKAVLSNGSDIALVTDICAIPFPDEGYDQNQSLIDDFQSYRNTLQNDRFSWSTLDDEELSEFVNVSDQYWL